MTRRLLVDLDYTIGFYNAAKDAWLIYDGALPALKELQENLPLVLATANTLNKVQKLFFSFPEVKNLFSEVITCEDFAPHFLKISDSYHQWIAEKKIDPELPILHFMHQLWTLNPLDVLPAGVQTSKVPPLSYDQWETEIYFPHVAPNKAALCGDYDLLIDDEFGHPSPNPLYRKMIEEGRTFFAGKRGGVTETTGPDWDSIRKLVLEVL